jgi:nucleoside-diphosphate-sugar epimerase
MDMRIAVTGSGGFIGSHLVPKLKASGYEVVEISRNQGCDLNNWDSVKDIPKCDILIHLAAKTFVPDSFNNPREFYQTNTNLTINALELAKNWKGKVIYMSSYFYGPPQYIPVDEKHPLNPHNPYAQTKYMSEELCKAYSRDFDVSIIAFRLFNIYGPGQTGSFLIPEILEKIKDGGKITLKDPRPKRDYIHVYDVISAIEEALSYNHSGFEVLNLGTGSSVSVEELVSTIQQYSPQKFEVEYTHEYRKGEVLDSVASVQAANKTLNWAPAVDLAEGIKTLFK